MNDGDKSDMRDNFGKVSVATRSRLFLKTLLDHSPVVEFLIYLSHSTILSIESKSRFSPSGITESKKSMSEDTPLVDDAIACCKRLKYCINASLGMIVRDIAQLVIICYSAQQFPEENTACHGFTNLAFNDNTRVSKCAPDLIWLMQLDQRANAFCKSALASVLFKDYLIAMMKVSEGIESVEKKLVSHATSLAKLAIDYIPRAVNPELKRLHAIMNPSTELAKHLNISTKRNAVALRDEMTTLTASDWERDVKEIVDALTLCTMDEVISSTTVGATLRKNLSTQIHFFNAKSLSMYTNMVMDLETVEPRSGRAVSTCCYYGDVKFMPTDSRSVDIIVANIDKLI